MTYTDTKWAERLNLLSALEPGWYEGYGEAVPTHALDKVDEILRLLDSPNFNVPGIYPMVGDGLVGLEWSNIEHGQSVNIELFTDSFTYEIFLINLKGCMEDDLSLNTNSFDEAIFFLKACLKDANLLTRCVTRD